MASGGAICIDCGVDTMPCKYRPHYCSGRRGCNHAGTWEFYIVHGAVWRAAMAVRDSYIPDDGGFGFPKRYAEQILCVGCIERRLGRMLNRSDFAACDLNALRTSDTPRLQDRKQRTTT
jgi:hypothetical protein